VIHIYLRVVGDKERKLFLVLYCFVNFLSLILCKQILRTLRWILIANSKNLALDCISTLAIGEIQGSALLALRLLSWDFSARPFCLKRPSSGSLNYDLARSLRRRFRFRYSFICQGTSTRRQRSDLFGLRFKLPPVTTSLTT